MTVRPEPVRAVGLPAALMAVFVCAMWGGNVVGIKVTLEALPPFYNAFWRMLLGLPLRWLWARVGGVRLQPEPREWRFLIILGALFGVQVGLLNVSVNWTSAAYSAVLLNAAPICTNLIAHFFVPHDKLTVRRLLGLTVAFTGVSVVLVGEPDPRLAAAPLLGNLLSVATAFLIGSRMVYTQRLVQRVEPARTIFWQVVFSLPVFLAGGLLWEPPMTGDLDLRAMLGMAYCSFGVVGLAFMLWARLLKEHPPGMISVFVFPTPLFGVLFSALIFQERLGPELLGGVALVAAGIWIVTTERAAQSASPRQTR